MEKEIEKFTKVKEIVLERMKYAGVHRLTKDFMQNVDVQFIDTFIYDEVEMFLEIFVNGMSKEKEHFVWVNVPSNWWQHLKQSFPKWYLKRFPVKTKSQKHSFKFDHKAIFTELNGINERIVFMDQNIGFFYD